MAAVATPDIARVVRNDGLRTKFALFSATPIADNADNALAQSQSQVCPQSRVADKVLFVLRSWGTLEGAHNEDKGKNYRPPIIGRLTDPPPIGGCMTTTAVPDLAAELGWRKTTYPAAEGKRDVPYIGGSMTPTAVPATTITEAA